MTPDLCDGDLVRVRGLRPLPGDVVAVTGREQARVHRYLGPIPALDHGRLRWRLLTCADDTRRCDPLALREALIGVVETPVRLNDRVNALAHWAREVGQRTLVRIRRHA